MDPYLTIASQPEGTLNFLSDYMESRGADEQQVEMRRKVLMEALVGIADPQVVVEIGCGTGAVLRYVKEEFGINNVIGVDPSPHFIEKARALAPDIKFVEGYSTKLDVADASVDVVIFYTTMNHIPEDQREASMKEVKRVLKPMGRALLFDNDCCAWSCALGPADPIMASIDRHIGRYITDPYVARKLPSILAMAGMKTPGLKIVAIADEKEGSFGHGMVGRAIDKDVEFKSLTPEEAEGLKAELQSRVKQNKFNMVLTYGYCVGFVNSEGMEN
eukprot:TRINITY_DN9253_c0_g6_i1.p1 TRINITY_DN9253_c0_g6~~TRINITY_DN9253_c0_g6_i1.p1  ORF type:complete len:305 (-),score=49.49 TRINITY_DN9253_c0_g6_i1:420-1241(-)